jgi:hypothetical protein
MLAQMDYHKKVFHVAHKKNLSKYGKEIKGNEVKNDMNI